MEGRGKLSSHNRVRYESPVREYSSTRLMNESGAKVSVPSADGSKRYIFEVGQVQSVDESDVKHLLSFTRSGCVTCGGSGSAPLFKIVEG